MKNIYVLILIFPIFGYGQVESFDDIKNINSLQQFKRVMLENRYEVYDKPSDRLGLYGLRIRGDVASGNATALEWVAYYAVNGISDFFKKDEWYFMITGLNRDRNFNKSNYDLIFSEVKKRCSFYKVSLTEEGDEVVLYSCPESTYKGKIGFVEKNDEGFIYHLIGR